MFREPYIDIDEWRDVPVRHHYIHGGFKGTELKFSFYFPDKSRYQGRFFQYVSPTVQEEDTALRGTGENNRIAFSFDSGGYLVESNMGGPQRDRVSDAVAGFRASAAAADYSRVVAMKMFGGKRPYGYIYGGSGGGYRTMAAIENTTVWDGAVPYVIGSPRGMQVMVLGHLRARRILRDKIPQIDDALDAGGSGDPYAGLSKDEAEALREVTRFGYPPRTWAYELMSMAPRPGLPGTQMDPHYLKDFWTKPGFEGADPTSYAARHRIQFPTKVAGVLTAAEAAKAGIKVAPPSLEYINPVGEDFARAQAQAAVAAKTPVAVRLASVPTGVDLYDAVLLIKSGAAAGKSVPLSSLDGMVATTDSKAYATLALLRPGDEVQIDNSDALASEVALRYQIPTRDYWIWDIYRDANSNPITPQIGVKPESAIAGTVQNGRFKAKVIVVASLLDETAHPWNAVWYRNKVKENLGPRIDDQFRLWFTDNAQHGDQVQTRHPTKLVSYLGILYQALRDVAAWVEKGVPPPPSTNFRLIEGQVVVPPTAAERRGVQPVATLTANGSARAEVKQGQPVRLEGVMEVPPGTGKIVMVEWDFGTGTFPVTGDFKHVSPTRATVSATHTFTEPGTHFVTLRATSQRQGDPQTLWGRIRNVARARVVVQ